MNNQSHPRLPYGMYPAEKAPGLYATGSPYAPVGAGAYQSPQASYLATNPQTGQRYMTVSQGGYPAIVTSSAMYTGAPSYMAATPGYYQSAQSLGHPAHAHTYTASSLPTSISYHPQGQLPTYIGAQLSPTSNPYAAAAAATGHPLYPSNYPGSPLAGLQQVQPSPVGLGAGQPQGPTARSPGVGQGMTPVAFASVPGAPGYQVGAHYPPY